MDGSTFSSIEEAQRIIETQSAKLDALSDLLCLIGEELGQEGGPYYSIHYSIEDVKDNLDRATKMMTAARTKAA